MKQNYIFIGKDKYPIRRKNSTLKPFWVFGKNEEMYKENAFFE